MGTLSCLLTSKKGNRLKHNSEDFLEISRSFSRSRNTSMTTMRSSSVRCHLQDLIDAASGNQNNALHKLYLSYPDPKTIDEEGQHTLIHASKLGHTCIVKILCEQGSDLDLKDLTGTTALIYAVRCGHKKIVNHLCSRRADVDSCDNKGRTALHYAAFRGCQKMTQILLKSGAKVDLQDNTGRSALHIAVARDNASVVGTLLAGGASLSLKDGEKVTARQCAEKRRCPAVQEVIDKYQKEKWSCKNRVGYIVSNKLLAIFSASKIMPGKDVDTELRPVRDVNENEYFQPERQMEEMTACQEVTGTEVEHAIEQGPRGTDVSLTSSHVDDCSLRGAANKQLINPTDQSEREPCKNALGSHKWNTCNIDSSPGHSSLPRSSQRTFKIRECDKLAEYETCNLSISTQKEDSPLTPPGYEPVFYPVTPTEDQIRRTANEEENALVTRLQSPSFARAATSTPVQNTRSNLSKTTNSNTLHPTPPAKVFVDPSNVSTANRIISHSTGVSCVEHPEVTAGAHEALLHRNGEVYSTPPPLPPKQRKKRENLDAIFAASPLPYSQREDCDPPLLTTSSTSIRSLTTLGILPPHQNRESKYHLHPEQQQILNLTRKQDCDETQKDVTGEILSSQMPGYAKAEILSCSSFSSNNLVSTTSNSLFSTSSLKSNTNNFCSFMTQTLPLPKKHATHTDCPHISRLTPSKRRARLNRMKDLSQNYQKDQEIYNQKETLSQSPKSLSETITPQQQNIELCRNAATIPLFGDSTSFRQADHIVAPPRLPRQKPGLLVKIPQTNSLGLSSPSTQNTLEISSRSQSPQLTSKYNTNVRVSERSEENSSHSSQTRGPGEQYDPRVKLSLWPSTETKGQSVLTSALTDPSQSVSTVATCSSDVRDKLETYTHSIDDPMTNHTSSHLNDMKTKRESVNTSNKKTQSPQPTNDITCSALESVYMRKRSFNSPGEASTAGHLQSNGRTYTTQLSDSDEYLIQNLKIPQGRDDKTSTFPRNSVAGGSSLSSLGSRNVWISSDEKSHVPENCSFGEKGVLCQDSLTLDGFNKGKKAIYQHMKRAISNIDLNQHFSTIKTSTSCPSITQHEEFGTYNISLKVIFKNELQVNCRELQVAKADFLATNNSQLQVYYNHDNNNHDNDAHNDSDENEEFG